MQDDLYSKSTLCKNTYISASLANIELILDLVLAASHYHHSFSTNKYHFLQYCTYFQGLTNIAIIIKNASI